MPTNPDNKTATRNKDPRVWVLPYLMPYAREIIRAAQGDIPHHPRLKPLRVPKLYRLRWRLKHATYSFISETPFTTVDERIRFARKLIVHLIRDNRLPLGSDIGLGVRWFRLNRAALSSPLSFSGAIRLQKLKQSREENQRIKAARQYWSAEMLRPDVPMPLILSHEGYELRELTTARHLVEIGKEAQNCLARRVGDVFLPNDVYFNHVRAGMCHIYTLRRAGKLLVVFSLTTRSRVEIQHLVHGEDIQAILKHCIPVIEAATGYIMPVSFPHFQDQTSPDAGRTPQHPSPAHPSSTANVNAPVHP